MIAVISTLSSLLTISSIAAPGPPTAAQHGKTGTEHARLTDDVPAVSVDARTALFHASERGDAPAIAKALLDGAAVDSQQQNGWTPLMVAVLNRRKKAAACLLRNGADVKHRSKLYYDYDALQIAISNGDFAMTALLLNHGADANQRDDEGAPPLLFVVGNGNISALRMIILCRLLVSHGADVRAKDKLGNSPLSMARNDSKRNRWMRPVAVYLERMEASAKK